MHLSGQVPAKITEALRENPDFILRGEGTQAIDLWAVHGGGRTVLDAVQSGFSLGEGALAASRAVLAAHGNMSSATIMFVLARHAENRVSRPARPGDGVRPRHGGGNVPVHGGLMDLSVRADLAELMDAPGSGRGDLSALPA